MYCGLREAAGVQDGRIPKSAGCGEGGCAAQGYKASTGAAGYRISAGEELGDEGRPGPSRVVVRAVGGARGGFETAGRFQGQYWDRGGVGKSDPHHSFVRTIRCVAPRRSKNKLCWRYRDGPRRGMTISKEWDQVTSAHTRRA